jgi:hypothetical protein
MKGTEMLGTEAAREFSSCARDVSSCSPSFAAATAEPGRALRVV